MIILQYFYQKLQHVELRPVLYYSIQNNFAEIWPLNLKDCYLCGNLWVNQETKCSIAHIFFHIFIKSLFFHDFVSYDEYLGRVYQIWKILTLVHIFADYSNPIPQRASFIHAVTHMFILTEILISWVRILITTHIHWANLVIIAINVSHIGC